MHGACAKAFKFPLPLYAATAFAFGLAVYGIAFAAQYWRVIPVMDGWATVTTIRHWSSGTSWFQGLLAQHNENRYPLVRLAYLVDFSLFDGRSSFVYGLLVLSMAALGTLLGVVASRGMLPAHRVFAISVGVALAAAPIQIDNLVQPFHFAWWSVEFLAVSTFLCLAWMIDRGGIAPLILTAIFATLSVYASGSGLIVPMMVIAAVFILPIAIVPRMMLSATCAAGIGSFFISFVFSPNPFAADLHHVGGLINLAYGTMVHLGMIAQRIGVRASAAVGFAGLIASISLAFIHVARTRKSGKHDAATTALLLTCCFTALTGFLISLGRVNAGAEALMASRYGTNAALFWGSLIGVFCRMQFPRTMFGGQVIAATLLALVLLGSYFRGPAEMNHVAWRAHAATVVTEQLRAGKIDPVEIMKIFPPGADAIKPDIAYLRAAGLSIFAY